MKASLIIDADDPDELLEVLAALRAVRNGAIVADQPAPADPARPADDAPHADWIAYAQALGDTAAPRRSKAALVELHGS